MSATKGPSALHLTQATIMSRLFKLPAELRNQIYTLALDKDSQQHASVPKEPALLRTNRQVRRETLPIFYGNTTFSFVTLEDTKKWLECLPPDRLELLRSVHAASGRHEVVEWFWSDNRQQAKTDLLELWQLFKAKGLREDALKLPMRVEEEVGDEWGVCWIGFGEIDGYVQKYKGFVRRKSVDRAR